MKRMILSDVHGSYPRLKGALQWFDQWQIDQLILLGDLLYHGPRNDLPDGYNPKLCIELYNQHKDSIMAVRGNCDSEVDQMVLQFPMMSDYVLCHEGNQSFFLTHGHVYHVDRMPPLKKGDVFMSGHTHVPVMEERNGVYLLNPGSISIPKNGSEPSFGLLENGMFYLMSLEGKRLNQFACR